MVGLKGAKFSAMEHKPSPAIRHLATAVLTNLLWTGVACAHPVSQGSAFEHASSAQHASAQAKLMPARHSQRVSPQAPLQIDRTGRSRIGIASYYANYFAGRKMADGARMDPHGSNAASRTLPLGTVAKVTNLSTRRSAVVTIEDRGPYVRGRIVDLSPSTARRIGITHRAGLARVRVTPLAVPPPVQPIRIASAARNTQALSGDEPR
jgi:rare lipoprotein A